MHKKARLVVQGFLKVPGIDYFDTYAPVACLASIWMILALAVHNGMEIHQIDIKGTYLNGKLNDNGIIYIYVPTPWLPIQGLPYAHHITAPKDTLWPKAKW